MDISQKKTVKQALLVQLANALEAAKQAAKNAHLAAIDDQSVAETQYDTLAIEASYLAEGHSRRVNELSLAMSQVSNLIIEPHHTIAMASLIQLASQEHHYFISPAGGGLTIKADIQTTIIITPSSPIGAALMGKEEGDEVIVSIGENNMHDEIISIV
ncbi:GreA/GreB family elongation factor [Thalassotalea sp. PP2-459]|uniref:GreA/GreB family elongation factor n=1 Tax=Thalassotalea sp. PP2-459 TaxID=1742724 RepID=UPI00094411F4|nr:GreA/GreB family elongation factor [Thalassotalea sp. PP2-459]OKY25295.1 hypothetical protein BI291_16880 [Thalassotalea sp. PP2-459]